MKATESSIKKWRVLCLIFLVVNIAACDGSGGSSGGTGDNTNNSDSTDNLIGVGFNKAQGFNGSVQTIVLDVDGSGSMYVGGEFNTYNNTQAGHLVRLKSDGTVDEAFVTGAGFTGPFSLISNIIQATDGSGDIYVSGRFNDYNGTPTRGPLRLNADGSIDSEFTTDTGASNITLATDGSGDIYATMGNSIVRLNSDGSIDTGFNSGTGFTSGEGAGSLLATTDGSGDIYVAGNFSSYNGASVNDLIRLDVNGLIATTEGVTKFTTGTGFAGSANKMVLADDGSGDIYVGGSFSSYNAVSANGLIKLNADGSIDSELTIDSELGIGGGSVQIRSLILAADGTGDLYVGGNFTFYNGKVTNRFLRINADGTEDAAFVTGLAFDNGTGGIGPSINSIAVTTSGGVYVGGTFANYNGTAQNNLIRINTDGTVDTTFTAGPGTGFDSQVFDIAATTDNSNDIYVAGTFNRYNGITANGLVRLNSDGTVDTEFVTGSGFGANAFVSDLALTQNNTGDIYVAGSFKNYNGTPVNSIVRLNPDGTIDSEFNAGSGASAASVFQIKITIANDGSNNLYVSGITSYNGTIVNGIVRLNSDGKIDPSFDTGTGFGRGINNSATLFINDLALATDGSGDIYVAGLFNSYNGKLANSLVRLNNDGTLDTEFSTGTGFITVGGSLGSLFSLVPAIDGSGDIYLSGNFNTYNNEPARDLIRLNADGKIDTKFNTEGAFDISSSATVRFFLPAADGSGDVLIGGEFDSYKGVRSRSLVRLNADGSVDAALTVGAAGFGGGSFGTGGIASISLATDNSDDIFIGGGFTSYQTTTVDYIVRLNSDGTLN